MFEKDAGTNNDFGIPSSTRRFSEYYARLLKQKVEKIKNHCKEILRKLLVSVRELIALIGWLSSTAVAVFPAPLQ